MKNISNYLSMAFGILILGLSLFNITKTYQEINSQFSIRKKIPFQFYGERFEGIKEILNNEKFVSYITDKNLENPGHLANLLQAQHTVAPLILDPNSTNHKFGIIDFQNKNNAIQTLKQLNAQPYKVSPNGLLIVQLKSL